MRPIITALGLDKCYSNGSRYANLLFFFFKAVCLFMAGLLAGCGKENEEVPLPTQVPEVSVTPGVSLIL